MTQDSKSSNQISRKQAVFEIVKQIPSGKVMYFGQIADLVGTTARQVGFILTGMNQDEMKVLPWYRVVAKDGYISSLKLGDKGLVQKQILTEQNYFINNDKVDMNQHLWLLAGIQHLEERVEEYSGFIAGLKR